MDKKYFTCIACPNGCKLTVYEEDGEIVVKGASCDKGIDHGINEYTNPMRMLTTTVAITGASHRRLSVASSAEIPKSKMEECLACLYDLMLAAPVEKGQVILADICGTGVDVIASRSMKKR